MMSAFSDHLLSLPDWRYDAAHILNEPLHPSELHTIENPERFGHTPESLRQFLQPFSAYRQAVLDEALPLLDQYPLIKESYQTPLPESLSEEGSIYSLVPHLLEYIRQERTDDASPAERMKEFLVLLCLDKPVQKEEEARSLAASCADLESFTRLIEKSALESSFTMLLIRLYLRREDFCRQLFQLTDQVVLLLKSHFHMIQEEFQRVFSVLSSYRDFHDFMHHVAHFPDPKPDYQVFLSVFPYNTVASRNRFYHVGLYVLDLTVMSSPSRLSDAQLLTDLKAVADSTRLQILRLLCARPMYSQELAQALKLTPATISHHLDVLRRSNLLNLDLANEQLRLYYTVNLDRLRQISSALLTFELPERRERL